MKITKIDGISHKKYEEKGKLVTDNQSDFTEERFKNIEEKSKEMFEKTLDFYIKDSERCKEHNKKRRKALKDFFSQILIKLNDENKIDINVNSNNNFDEKILENFNYTDVRNEKYFNILEKILKQEKYEEEELIIFKEELEKKFNRLKSIKNSLEKNKAHFSKKNVNENYDEVKGHSRKSFFYEYYKSSSMKQEYINSIYEAFDKLYGDDNFEDTKKLFEKIKENEKEKIKKIREDYHNILKKNQTEFGEELYNKIQENSEKIEELVKAEPKLKELTKSQIFYKYYIDKTKLDEIKIKYCFYHFVEMEVNGLLKKYVYKKTDIDKNKLENIFEYFKLRTLIKNKLVNKLNNYIRNCGKYNHYIDDTNIINSIKISEIRKKEAFLRNIIGVSSSAYFSLRNILNSKNEKDITNKGEMKKEINNLYQSKKEIELEKNLKLFFGNYFDIKKLCQLEIEVFFENINDIISSIRNRIIHFNKNTNAQTIFDFNNVSLGNVAQKIFNEEINEEKIKIKIFRQLNSANVFDYLDSCNVLKYLDKVNFSFVNKNVSFVPSFTKLYNRVQNLLKSLNLSKWKISIESEGKDAQIFLLKNIYYGEFLDEFLNEKSNLFIEAKDEIIKINKKQNEKTGYSKLERFEKIKEKNPKEYLKKIHSLYMVNIEEMKTKDENIFLDFVQKIFLKGFYKYIQNKYKYLLELNKIRDRKNIFDKQLSEYKNDSQTLEKTKGIYEIIKKIKIKNISNIINNIHKIKPFYLLLKLLNHKEIIKLKGNLEKYCILSKSDIFKNELTLLNIINLDNNKMIIDNLEISSKEIGKFLEKVNNKKIETFKELRNFEKKNNTEYYNIYSDNKNIKNIKGLYNIKKYGMLDLLEKISEKSKYYIAKKDIEEFEKLKKKLENEETDFYKIQKDLHIKYQRKPNGIKNKPDYKKYEQSIKSIEKYVHLKNKIEFNELNLLQSLLLKVLHRLVGYTSIWERDLRFKLIGEFPEEHDIENIFDFKKDYKKERGQIVPKYIKFIKAHTNYISEMENIELGKKTDEKGKGKTIYVRNYIAHFNYIPNAEYSFLEIIEKLRKLLSYDRKLKNAVMKSIKDILNEYGFIGYFKIREDKKIVIEKIDSKEIKHFNNGDLKTQEKSIELCNLIKAMFEYKKDN